MTLEPWLTAFLFNCLAVWPLVVAFRRAGLRPWWAFLVFVPVAGLVLAVAALLFQRWPVLPPRPVPPPVKRRRTA